MSISETILGPNSSMFTMDAGNTPTTLLSAVNTYIVNHGWELFDANVGTAPIVANVYRTLQQDGGAYKYVMVSFATNGYTITPYESWNNATHTGTNPITSVNTAGSLSVVNTTNMNFTSGAAIIMFVNQKWLAMRFRSNVLVYSDMVGAFEIAKDFGEAPSVLSNILMTTKTQATFPAGTSYGFYGSLSSNGNTTTSTTATNTTNIATAIGIPASNDFSLGVMTKGTVTNSALTMTAVEMGGNVTTGVARFRGRIMGIKLISGTSVWNDMDTAQITVDSDFHQSATGAPMQHHILAMNIGTYVRFLIPV